MKKACLILIFTWVCFSDGHSQKKSSLQELNLKGNVVAVYENVFKAEYRGGKWEEGEKDYMGHTLTHFNEEGNITESVEFDRDDRVIRRQVYLYDTDGYLKEGLTSDSTSKQITRQVHIRDSRNRVVAVQNYERDGEMGLIHTTEYSDSGKPAVKKITNREGTVYYIQKYEWDGDHMKAQTNHRSSGELEATVYFTRDKGSSEVTGIHIITANGTVVNDLALCYEFDENGNWVSKLTVDRVGRYSTFTKRRFVYR
ncbi:hypothetical protein [Sabulibacter ruber]|uniref:hypothetical protein n=1 Tax=Sabulibacter ruber TaxID=2811901 RepID=UPI001A97BE28|nr:hypothetical protein [Sabulibacter ruber]